MNLRTTQLAADTCFLIGGLLLLLIMLSLDGASATHVGLYLALPLTVVVIAYSLLFWHEHSIRGRNDRALIVYYSAGSSRPRQLQSAMRQEELTYHHDIVTTQRDYDRG